MTPYEKLRQQIMVEGGRWNQARANTYLETIGFYGTGARVRQMLKHLVMEGCLVKIDGHSYEANPGYFLPPKEYTDWLAIVDQMIAQDPNAKALKTSERGDPVYGYACPQCGDMVVYNGNYFCESWGCDHPARDGEPAWRSGGPCNWAMAHYDPIDDPELYQAEEAFGVLLMVLLMRSRKMLEKPRKKR